VCLIEFSTRKNKDTFTVNSITQPTLGYEPADNADPDGDSDGTVIVVLRP
jgi:hypothetical protein